jgi:hypothetical protein
MKASESKSGVAIPPIDKKYTGATTRYRKSISSPEMNSLSKHIAMNMTTGIPNTEQDSDILILKRYLLVEFMSTPIKRDPVAVYDIDGKILEYQTPPSTPTRKEIQKFCEDADIPIQHWTRWLWQKSFKDEVAGKARESIYEGEGAASAYIALEAAMNDPSCSSIERAKIATTIAKLHLKHLEIMVKAKMAQGKNKQTESTKNTLEEILNELKQGRTPKLIEMKEVKADYVEEQEQ